MISKACEKYRSRVRSIERSTTITASRHPFRRKKKTTQQFTGSSSKLIWEESARQQRSWPYTRIWRKPSRWTRYILHSLQRKWGCKSWRRNRRQHSTSNKRYEYLERERHPRANWYSILIGPRRRTMEQSSPCLNHSYIVQQANEKHTTRDGPACVNRPKRT